MTRSSSKRGAQPLQSQSRITRAHPKEHPSDPEQTTSPKPTDLKSGIVVNWNLSSDNINTCVSSERWPLDVPDPEQWPVDIIHLLHQASEHTKGKNDLFKQMLKEEIVARQKKNKSAKGKTDCMLGTDLKKVCKRLKDLAQETKDTGKQATQPEVDTKALGRGGSNKASQDIRSRQTRAANDPKEAREENQPRRQGKSKPNNHAKGQPRPHPPKRTASDLPLRPARRPRTIKSPKAKASFPPPETPANPPEASEDEDEEQENDPPEPVSGRHIYGDYIPPVTIEFNPEEDSAAAAAAAAAAQPQTRQTRSRKRARAEEGKEPETKPTQVQIDSDPRDIDATGFLSELDPKEARRRRKPRLSRLQAEVVAEPAWSQDVLPLLLETPVATPAVEGFVGVASAVMRDGDAMSEMGGHGGPGLEDVLVDLLPRIPEHATNEERIMLEDRMELLRKDVMAYQRCVWEIEER